MAQAEVLARLQKETRRLICPDDRTKPVTIECEHNFCQSAPKTAGQSIKLCSPVLSANTSANTGPSEAMPSCSKRSKSKMQEPSTSCQKHNQFFSVFCEDLQLLCDQCSKSESHRHYKVTPSTEAASLCRKNLQGYINILKRQVEEVQELISVQNRATLARRQQAEAKRSELTSEFEQCLQFLHCEEQAAFSRLEEEEEKKLFGNIAPLECYGSVLRDLLSQVMLTGGLSEAKVLFTVKDFYLKATSRLISPTIFPFSEKEKHTTSLSNIPPYGRLYNNLQTMLL